MHVGSRLTSIVDELGIACEGKEKANTFLNFSNRENRIVIYWDI